MTRNAGGGGSAWVEAKAGNGHVGQKIDDQVEALAAPTRQDCRDPKMTREWPIDGVDGKSHAEPYEHPLPIASRCGDERKRAKAAPLRQEVNRRGA